MSLTHQFEKYPVKQKTVFFRQIGGFWFPVNPTAAIARNYSKVSPQKRNDFLSFFCSDMCLGTCVCRAVVYGTPHAMVQLLAL